MTIGQEEKLFLPIALAQQGKTGYPSVLCLCFACKACCSMLKHVFCCSVLHVQVSAVSANRCSWINMLLIPAISSTHRILIENTTKTEFLCYRLKGSCNHVAGLLFRVEYAVRTGLTKPSCTSQKSVWNVPGAGDSVPVKLCEQRWTRDQYMKKGKSSQYECLYEE